MNTIEESANRFEDWLNNETDGMSDADYLGLLEEIDFRVGAAMDAKKAEMEEGDD